MMEVLIVVLKLLMKQLPSIWIRNIKAIIQIKFMDKRKMHWRQEV
jgi:hypothetical protein